MKKSLIFVTVIASLMSVSAWAQMSSDDMATLKSTAHDVETGLMNKDSKAACAGIDRLHELSSDMIIEKSAPDETTYKSLKKLISFNTSTEQFMAFCGNPDSKPADSEEALKFMKSTVYPALQAVEKSHHFAQQVSLNEPKN